MSGRSIFHHRKLHQLIVVMGALLLLITPLTHAQGISNTWVVTSLADSMDTGTLRWAITQLNNSLTMDVITFENGLSGTITLTSDLPTVIKPLTIRGTGQDIITIDGAGAYNAFSGWETILLADISDITLTNFLSVIDITGGQITLTDVTISESGLGGDDLTYPPLLIIDASATLTRVTMADNQGFWSGALLYITHNPDYHLTITDSLFIGNSSNEGIVNIYDDLKTGGDVTHYISNTTFVDNDTRPSSVVLWNHPFVETAGRTKLIVTNSTFSESNDRNLGFIIALGYVDVEVKFTTMYFHLDYYDFQPRYAVGAGIGASIDMVGSIITSNQPNRTLLCSDDEGDGTLTGSHNLTSDPNCQGRIASPTGIDSVLADHGGHTQTHALLAESNAINAYTGTECPATDQRGVVRPAGAFCDIGAYESEFLTLPAGVTLSKTAVAVAEGGVTDTYTVVLNSQPTGQVYVGFIADDQCSTDSEYLAFFSNDWNIPQTVMVLAVDDEIQEGEHACTIAHLVTSPDTPAYEGLSVPNVTGTITDDDLAGITLNKAMIGVVEGGSTDSYTLILDSQPAHDVIITVHDDAQCHATVEALTFTASTWNTPQTVTVNAVDDAVFEGQHPCTITHTVTSTDAHYDGFSIATITGSITDDEAESVTTELLDNGGFEIAGTSNALPANWTVQNAKGDKRMCPTKTGNLHSGACAFKFTGNGHGVTKLTQVIDLTGHTFGQQDTLTISAYLKGITPASKLKIHLSVYYLGAKALVKGNFKATGHAAYVQYSLPIYTLGSNDLNSSNITQIKLEFIHQGNAGTLWIDDVSAIHTVPAVISRESALPMPVAPDGFRGNN